MRRSSFLRAISLCLLGLTVGCGAEDPATMFPDEDGSIIDTDTGEESDAGAVPSFDIPVADAGNPSFDSGTPVDRGVTPTDRGTPVDTGVVTPTDRGGPVMCPSSCSADLDCDPCRTSSDPDSVRYCCLSGLCISMTGVCPSTGGPTPGSDGGGAGGDGGGSDGGGGADSGGGVDAGGGPG